MSRCSIISGHGHTSLSLRQGNQILLFYNASYNMCDLHSSGVFWDSDKYEMKMSTITSNRVTSRITFWFGGVIGKSELCNIVNNTSPSYGVFQCDSKLTIMNCIFYNNFNTLIYRYSGSITVNNCWISHSSTIFSGGSISTTNIMGLTNPYTFTHFHTFLCSAIIPYTLTPFISLNYLKSNIGMYLFSFSPLFNNFLISISFILLHFNLTISIKNQIEL